MVRLLRLETDDDQGRFDTLFNEDVVIKKDTKIALHSISAETSFDNIVINRSNDIMKYRIGTNTEREIRIDSAIYQLNNIGSLFNDIQNVLNDSLVSDNTNNIAIQWFCNDAKGVVNIGYDRCLIKDFDKPGIPTTIPGNPQQTMVNITRINSGTTASGAQTFKNNTFQTDQNTSYFYQTHEWCKGSALMRARPSTLISNGEAVDVYNNGFRIALMNVNPSTITAGTSIPESNIFFSLRINRTGEPIRIKTSLAGNEIDTAVNAAPQQVLEMMCVGKDIRFRVYRDGQAAVNELGSVTLPVNADGTRMDLYPVTFLYGDDTDCVIDNYRCSTVFPVLDNDPAPVVDEVLDVGLLGAYPSYISPRNDNKDITFTINSAELYEALGFTQSINTQRNRHLDLLALNTFHLTNQSDCIIVEMANVSLDSYDSLTEGRKSILNCISLNDQQVSINYEMRNLVYIDVNNTNDRLLRNIKINLLRHDHTPLLTRGKTSLVLLLSE